MFLRLFLVKYLVNINLACAIFEQVYEMSGLTRGFQC
jgi:hypothetical protein